MLGRLLEGLAGEVGGWVLFLLDIVVWGIGAGIRYLMPFVTSKAAAYGSCQRCARMARTVLQQGLYVLARRWRHNVLLDHGMRLLIVPRLVPLTCTQAARCSGAPTRLGEVSSIRSFPCIIPQRVQSGGAQQK